MNTSTHMTLFNVKQLAEKYCIFSTFPLLLYINRNSALPSLCEASHKDGWGEGFEQREINIDRDAELYVHLWNSDNWSIQTEEECFAPKLADRLPEMCFSTLKTTGDLICIKRGESGYYPSDWDTHDKERNAELADELNEQLGVTIEQRKAMEAGSMFDWSCPAANPTQYQQDNTQSGVPAEAQRSGFGGERSSSEMSEPCPQGEAKDMELGTTMGGMTLG